MNRLYGFLLVVSFLLVAFSKADAYDLRTQAPLITIGELQGEALDCEYDDVKDCPQDAKKSASPYELEIVRVKGLVYQWWYQRRSGTEGTSFFIQNLPEDADGNDLTSDGVKVSLWNARFIPKVDGWYIPEIGDVIEISAEVQEWKNETQLRDPQLEKLIKKGLSPSEALPEVIINPPKNKIQAGIYWERIEGMRCIIPKGAVSQTRRKTKRGSTTETAYFISPGSELLQRENPYTRRVFRDPHPLDDIFEEYHDNENVFRYPLASLNKLDRRGEIVSKTLPPLRAYDSLTKSVPGAVTYQDRHYMVIPNQKLSIDRGINPAENNPPPLPEEDTFTVVTYNVENLFDYHDDPFDSHDFKGNRGDGDRNKPPFDYAPNDEEEYRSRLVKLARHIIDFLYSPDILMMQEIEDQDVKIMENGELAPASSNSADGLNDILQELILSIKEEGGPEYYCANNRKAADKRGIVCGFLYRADRVELEEPTDDHPLLGTRPPVQFFPGVFDYAQDTSNPKAINGSFNPTPKHRKKLRADEVEDAIRSELDGEIDVDVDFNTDGSVDVTVSGSTDEGLQDAINSIDSQSEIEALSGAKRRGREDYEVTLRALSRWFYNATGLDISSLNEDQLEEFLPESEYYKSYTATHRSLIPYEEKYNKERKNFNTALKNGKVNYRTRYNTGILRSSRHQNERLRSERLKKERDIKLSNSNKEGIFIPKGNVFSRAMQLAVFKVWEDGVGTGEPINIYAMVNHFSSVPNKFVVRRMAQAAFNAETYKSIKETDPDALVIVGGDLNIYPRPDDPYETYWTDQLGPLYRCGMLNLYDMMLLQAPESAYTYTWEGQAQTLDHLFVSRPLSKRYVIARVAHINTDHTGDEEDSPYGVSDHDPVLARFRF